MRDARKAQREIADELGLSRVPVKSWINRKCHAASPMLKWATDISYIHTGEGIFYLSVIRDLRDNSIVAYKSASAQTVSLVLDTIRMARKAEKKTVAAQLHSFYSHERIQLKTGEAPLARRLFA